MVPVCRRSGALERCHSLTLTLLSGSGDIIRIAHGAYRDAGSPSDEDESLRSARLMTNPSALAYERIARHPIDFVVSGESAARLHGIGDLRALRHEFTTPRRKQKQRIATLPEHDVTVVQGLPKPLAKRKGHQEGDSYAMLEQPLSIAGVDHAALSQTIAADPRLGSLVTGKYLESLSTAIAAYQSSELKEIKQVVETLMAVLQPIKLFQLHMHTTNAAQLANIAKALKSLAMPNAKDALSGIFLGTSAQRPPAATDILQSVDQRDLAAER